MESEHGSSPPERVADWKTGRDIARKVGKVLENKLFIMNTHTLLAVDAVQSKPLSRLNSLLSGKFAGVFGSFATQ
jgi:hypothetical protein